MGLSIWGGIAFDSISIEGSEPHDVLGGSAVYAALAASLVGEVAVFGAIGDDCDMEDDLAELARRPEVTLVIQCLKGRTARFRCDYNRRFTTRETLAFSPGVSETLTVHSWQPPCAGTLFLASGPPVIQLNVLETFCPRFSAVDTIEHWITTDRASLETVVSKANAVLLTADEALLLTGHDLVSDAASAILGRGPRLVCVKQGEFGAQVFGYGFKRALPAFAASTVDPTGAGDAFAGAFLRYLTNNACDVDNADVIGEALVLGTAVASICVEGFGIEALASTDLKEVTRRCRLLLDSVQVGMPRL